MKSTSICLLSLLAVCCLSSAGCAHKYAVLISANNVTMDDVSIHSEWWYDLILQYKMLREKGYKERNIYVLYGNGTDFSTSHSDYNSTALFGHSITNMPVSKANVQAVFSTLSPKVRPRDYLYVWWMGHGGGSGPGQCNLSMSISNTGEFVSDAELKTYVDQVTSYKKRSIAVMTCHSGGMVDNFNVAGSRTVVLASSTCAESSYDAPSTCNGRVQAEFNYTEPNALRKQDPCGTAVPSDTDASGGISLLETHAFNAAQMSSSTPQLGDPDSIAGSTVP
jgi:peptidase C13-like protein